MPKPACPACQRFMRPKKNGVFVLEQMPVVHGALPGKDEPDKWQPYKIWQADLWQCQGCGAEQVSGWGYRPVREHYEEGFKDLLEVVTITINDC